jgi:hypothetical protein
MKIKIKKGEYEMRTIFSRSIFLGSIAGPVAVVIFAALIGTGNISAFAQTASQGQPIVGKVAFIEGVVLIDSKIASNNANVREGSIIEVKNGKATLLLGKGSVFHLAANTTMVVNQFGVKPAGTRGAGEEGGTLDLKFGRTRALILNEGNEKKDVTIKARAATMGVRGTEIFISAPQDPAKPVQFFTLEGKAEVKASAQGNPVVLTQNQGVATHGGANGEAATTSAPSMTVAEVKAEIKSIGMDAPPPTHVATDSGTKPAPVSGLSDQFNAGSVPPVVLDPVQDRLNRLTVTPRYCSARTGVCSQ